MWSILIVLVVGISIGATVNFSDKFKKINGKLQHLGVVILLFAMGASLGLNKSLLANIKDIGVIALVFATLTSAASIFLVYMVSHYYMKGKKD